jgi:hypothetical protein
MNEDVKAVLRQIRSTTRGNGYVFSNPDTPKPYTDRKTAFETACQLAGLKIALARPASYVCDQACGGGLQ